MNCPSYVGPGLRSLLVTFAVLAAAACGPAAKLHVTKSLEAKLGEYETVHITATGSTAQISRAANKFEEILARRLKTAKLFDEVTSDGELVLACKITHMEFGDEDTRELSLREKAAITIEIRITKPDGTLLGHVTVTATARRKNADDQPAVRVLELAADEVVDYLASRAEKTKPAPAPKAKAAPKPEPEEEDAGESGDADAEGSEAGEGDEEDSSKPAADAKAKAD